jgi:hypothetical protein
VSVLAQQRDLVAKNLVLSAGLLVEVMDDKDSHRLPAPIRWPLYLARLLSAPSGPVFWAAFWAAFWRGHLATTGSTGLSAISIGPEPMEITLSESGGYLRRHCLAARAASDG